MACFLGDLLYVRYFETWQVDDSGMPTQLTFASSSPTPNYAHTLYWCLACSESFATWEDAKEHLFLSAEPESGTG